MQEKEKEVFYRTLKKALDAYFKANVDAQGESDSLCVFTMVEDHLEACLSGWNGGGAPSNTDSTMPGITLIDGEGINVAYDYGSAIRSDLFKSLSNSARLELLESCIYALNTRLNALEGYNDEDHN